MKCPNCQQENEAGRFCVHCGSSLEQSRNDEVSAVLEKEMNTPYVQPQIVQPIAQNNGQQPNAYLQNAKHISQSYFSYFSEILKKPYAMAKQVGTEQLLNGIISIILYALILPLVTYLFIKMNNLDTYIISPFLNIVIRPMIGYAVFAVLVGTFTYAALKLNKVTVSYKEIISKLGAWLVPFTAILVIAGLLALLKFEIFILFLIIGFFGLIFTVPVFLILNYKQDNTVGGLDTIYSILLTYAATFILLRIMGQWLFEMLAKAFAYNSFF